MKKLAVIGPGLLGGSIALAAGRVGEWRVAAWARRPEAAADLVARGIATTASTDLRAVAADADLVVLCVPIGAMPALAQELAEIVPAGAVITDVGSVKESVVNALGPLFRERGHFVGSHPMAGSEQTGIDAARADLFGGSVCIMTPDEESRPVAVETVTAFWESLGCRVRSLSPREHDETVALVSHLPHFLAAALVNTIAAENAKAFEFAGPGFRDTSRVASGPPAMWAEIFAHNRAAVKKSTEAMIEKLRESLKLLDSPTQDDDLHMNEFLSQAKAQRDRLRLPR